VTTPQATSFVRSESQPTPKKSAKRWRLLAGVATTSLILSACIGPTEVTDKYPADELKDSNATSEPSGPSAPTDEDAPEELANYYNAVIEWEDCGKNYECGTLEVPMDYDNPEDDVFTLALGRRAATDPDKRLGSLLLNPGGPGGSGLTMLDSIGLYFSADVMEHYDVIGFDPRGVGESEPAVSCLTDAERDERRALTFDLDTDAGMQAFIKEAGEYAAKCEENTGPGLEFIDTVSSASDMDIIRSAVGDEKLNYVGYSYGTFLGATYAELFPERIGRVVFDGALDPSLNYEGVGAGQARGFDRALRAYLEYCLDREACPLSGSVDSALDELQEFFEDLNDHPLPTHDSARDLNGEFAMSGLIVTLYSRDSWPMLTMALGAAMRDRDGAMLLSFADLSADREEDGTYIPGTEAFTAINCLDYSPDPDVDAMRKDAAELEEISPFFGPVLAYGGASCAEWPYDAKRTPAPLAAAGSDEILVIGTTRDPATPYEWAVAMDEQLENSTLLTFDGDGHTAYGNGNTCIAEVVDDYLINGETPPADTTCEG